MSHLLTYHFSGPNVLKELTVLVLLVSQGSRYDFCPFIVVALGEKETKSFNPIIDVRIFHLFGSMFCNRTLGFYRNSAIFRSNKTICWNEIPSSGNIRCKGEADSCQVITKTLVPCQKQASTIPGIFCHGSF
jgi:hypothetical protein